MSPGAGFDPDEAGWPEATTATEREAVVEAKAEMRVARDADRLATSAAERKARLDADLANLQQFAKDYTAVGIGVLERRQAGARTVQTAATAVATLYTGILALSFSVSDNPLPPRGILTPLFLGAAVVLSTYYLAWATKPDDVDEPVPAEDLGAQVQANVLRRAGLLVGMVNDAAGVKAKALRAGVAALAVGLVYLALPFVAFGGSTSAPSREDWPPATVEAGETLELVELRYSEQLKETAAQRQLTAVPDPGREVLVILIATAIGAAAVVGAWRWGEG